MKNLYNKYSLALNLQDELVNNTCSESRELQYATASLGKKVRSLLFYICLKENIDCLNIEIFSLPASIELLHLSSLIHDDVIDLGQMRRGAKTIFAEFGVAKAVMVGDYLFVKSLELCKKYNQDLLSVLIDSCSSLLKGESKEQNAIIQERNIKDLWQEYDNIVEFKTSSLFVLPVMFADKYSCFSKDVKTMLLEFTGILSSIFQAIDDISDVFENDFNSSKTKGNDLRSAVPSVINLLWLENDKEYAETFFSLEKADRNWENAAKRIKEQNVIRLACKMIQDKENLALSIINKEEFKNEFKIVDELEVILRSVTKNLEYYNL